MKYLGQLLIIGVTLFLVLFVGILNLFSSRESSHAAIVISIDRDIAPLKASLAEREATYQAQLDKIDETIQEQQVKYQAKIETLNTQILAAQQELTDLQTQKQNLESEITRLEAIRSERSTAYQNQLQQIDKQYAESLAQLQTQLDEAKANLTKVNLQLQNR